MQEIKELERLLKALANKRRLAILRLLLKEKELTVTDIAEGIGLSFTSTSKHLNILAKLDVVDREQKSLQVFYRLPPKPHFLVKTLLPSLSNSRE